MDDPPPAAAMQSRLAALDFLADPDTWPVRWAQLDRVRRLFACRLRSPSSLARLPLVAVIGGTNVGKSTLFNLLLGQRIAQPCPTAAGTKAVALSVPAALADSYEAAGFLPWFDILPWAGPEPLNAVFDGDTPRLYLHRREGGPGVALADTPDIDSTTLQNHRTTEDLFFLADAVLFVTTEQKYADEACDRYLAAAARFGKAIAVVFNRSERGSPAWTDLVEAKLPLAGLPPDTPVLAIPVLTTAEQEPGDPPARQEVSEVSAWVVDLSRRADVVLEAARRGAVTGFCDELEETLQTLEGEVAGVRSFLARGAELIERETAGELLHADLDDLDQAVLEALEELRVPGIDWVYEQLGLARRRLLGGFRFVGSWLRQVSGTPVRTLDDVAAEELEREREHARTRLDRVASGLRLAAQEAPAEVRLALLSRLPQLGPESGREEAVEQYLVQLETRRREIIRDARQQILAELQEEGTRIRVLKGMTRTASVVVSVTAAVTSGGLSAHDLAVAPLADAATKWLLDRHLGQAWRERLQREVEARRRALVSDWLQAAALTPLVERLPRCHRDDFLETTRQAAQALRETARDGGRP